MPAPFYTLTSNSSYKHKYPALLALYPFTVRLLLLPNSSISGSDQPNNIASWFTGRSTRKKLGGLGRAKGRKEREVVITWNVNLECTNRSFSHDVTAAIFVYKTMNRRPCLCTKKILWELNSFHMLRLPFNPSNLQSCWPRDWKRSIGHFCWRAKAALGPEKQRKFPFNLCKPYSSCPSASISLYVIFYLFASHI